jgi:hypothetical protein
MIGFRFVCFLACCMGAMATTMQCEEGSQWFGSDCWCDVGYYSSDGRAPCSPCENSFNTFVGSSTCTCNPGFVGTSGINPCTKCGEFSDTLGGEPGWHVSMYAHLGIWSGYDVTTSYPGRDFCVCSFGSYGVSGRSPCSQCPPNSSTWYSFGGTNVLAVPAMDGCLCSPGFWNVNGRFPDDSDPCVTCPEYSTSLPGSTSCTLCKINAYRETPEAACQACPVGTTATRETTAVGMSVGCAKCDVGYYSPSGNSPCVPCEDGFTTTAIGQTTCWPWDSIHTGDPTRNPTAAPTGPSAKPSPRPSASPTIRKTSRPSARPTMQPTNPEDCLPGFHSATGKGPDCAPCPKGTTNDDYGQTSCPLCTDRYYSKSGRAPCRGCPFGMSSSALWDHTYCVHCVGYAPGCAKPHHKNGTTSNLRGQADEE